MSGGAFAAWWTEVGEAAGEGPADPGGWYVAEEGDALIRHDGLYIDTADILGDVTVGLADVVAMHGLVPRGREKSPQRWEPHRPSIRPAQARDALLRLPRTGARKDRVRLDRAATEATLDSLALLAESGGAVAYGPTIAGLPTSTGSGLEEVHLPIAVVNGLSLRIIQPAGYAPTQGHEAELTLRWRVGAAKEALYDAARRARQAGGVHAAAALMILERPREGQASVPEVLWRDIGPLTAPARLTDGEIDAPGPLPALTAFGVDELLEALTDLERGLSAAEGNDLVRWVCGVSL